MAKSKNIIFYSAYTSYNIIETKGSGGSGTVLKVKDKYGDTYALKYLAPDRISNEKMKRFKNEISFCEKSEHRNIIKVIDRGHIFLKDKQCLFYVMPYYEQNLRDLMKQDMPPNTVLPLFTQILDGIEAAHLQDVWHRDIKPENILFEPSTNTLVVADFGIAHFDEQFLLTTIKTKPQDRLANFQYAAPEQREKGASVDHRADIYALGLILNEMFTGKVVQGSKFIRIADKQKDYAYLDDLIDLMLRQSPIERPASIGEIKKQLIARGNDFVQQQHLSELKKKIIPDTEMDDPLVLNPPKLVDRRWEDGWLIMTLDQPVNPNWIQCFRNPDPYGYSSLYGKGPGTFTIQGNNLKNQVDSNDAQALIDYTKSYISIANSKYKDFVEKSLREKKKREKAELQRMIELVEKTREINKKLKI